MKATSANTFAIAMKHRRTLGHYNNLGRGFEWSVSDEFYVCPCMWTLRRSGRPILHNGKKAHK